MQNSIMITNIKENLLTRNETRLILPIEQKDMLVNYLSTHFPRHDYSDNHINRTVYFNNNLHEVPWGSSLRARQYFKNRFLSNGVVLDLSEPYIMEIKRASFDNIKTKVRREMSLDCCVDAITKLRQLKLTLPLRPYIVDEYERIHFVSRNEIAPFRITCDINPSYFYIDAQNFLHLLKKEEAVRVEIKTGVGYEGSEIQALLKDLYTFRVHRTISKKMTIYSHETGFYKATDGLSPSKELVNTEIESKLIVLKRDPYQLSNEMFQLFLKGVDYYKTAPEYPYVTESASMNSYYLPENNINTEGVKVLARPTLAKLIFKSNESIALNKHNLQCIVKRTEVKSKYFSLIDLNKVLKLEEERMKEKLYLAGELVRMRKAFWVNNLTSQRSYHISFDRCTSQKRTFYQVEIEYIGKRGDLSNDAEPLIVEDISNITQIILTSFPGCFKPYPLTKLEWIKEEAKIISDKITG